VFAALAAPPAFGTTAHPASSGKPATHTVQAHSAQAHGTHKGKSKARRPRGQQAMEPGRVTEIQQALIREHYLSGEANGLWDERTKAAMQKYQANQGWQTKLLPDARAIKKLGLGPDYSNAINAKNSSFGDPPPVSTIPPTVTDGFVEASGIKK
jgi:peptidoglycan hydrolase-like protein with peptidoglycan-binding domain